MTTKQTSLQLEGLHCADCAARIERGVRVQAQPAGGVAAEGLLPRRTLLRLGIAAAVLIAALLAPAGRALSVVLYLLAYVLMGGDVLLQAARNIARGNVFDENFLMGIATIGALALGEYPEAVSVMLFYQVGELFQNMAVNRSRRSITALLAIRAESAQVQRDGHIITLPPESVQRGEVIVVRPGERIPLDGRVIKGRSLLDTSALTGESLPRAVAEGDEALSGCINTQGVLHIEVTRPYGQSTIARILELVQNAAQRKAPTEQFITKFSRYYTPAVVLGAVALALLPPLLIPGALLGDWLRRALVFLVVSCPCALVLSIPLSFFGGIGAASRHGVLIKGSNYLEALTRVDTVAFDKTGTLTQGRFSVTQVSPAGAMQAYALLRAAAYAESFSTHPIALGVRRAYTEPLDRTQVEHYEEIPGKGVRTRALGSDIVAGNAAWLREHAIDFEPADQSATMLYVAVDGQYAGYLRVEDTLKADAVGAITRLKALGVRTVAMLTGDHPLAARAVADALHIDRVHAQLLPAQKVAALESLQAAKQTRGALVYVGDGINDAPVLARADVGVAMGALGSDAAIEAADVVLMTDELDRLAAAMALARRTRAIVWQNIGFALGVKAVVLALGAAGIATMWAAVFADVGVALIAVFNAMRILRYRYR